MKFWFTLTLLAAVHAYAAPDWPVGAEYRLEWQFKPATTPQFVRVPDYRRFAQLIPKTFTVCDETGKPTEAVVRQGDDGKPELWFEAASAHRYFSYWGKMPKPKLDEHETKIPEIGSDAEVATPGEMLRRPVWRVKNGVLEQTSAGKNLCLVSQPEFGDFELTCRVKAGAEAGVIVRGRPEDSDSSGAYWLLGAGENTLWGVVRDVVLGPGPLVREWNDLKVTAQGQTVTFALNGKPMKSVELPPGTAERGVIALATYGGAAEFDDVRVVAGGKVVFADDFAGTELDEKRWRSSEGDRCRGFVRVVNIGDRPRSFEMGLAFHREPWGNNGVAFDVAPTPPGQSTAWLYPGNLAPRAPFTVMIRGGAGRAEYVSALSDATPLRLCELPGDAVVEFSRANIYRADELQTDAEIGRATLEAVKAMKFKGKPPVRFPTGHPMGNEFDLQAGRLLGFNMLFGMPNVTREKFDALGFQYIFGYTHLLTAHGKGVGYRQAINRTEMTRLAEEYRKVNLLDRVYMISVFDEPGTNIKADMQTGLGKLEGDPDAWNQIITTAGLKPTDLIHADDLPPADAAPMSSNYWTKVRGWKTTDRDANPLGVYRTMQVIQAIYPCRFRNARTAIREAFGTNVLVTANVHADHWFKGTLTDIEPWGMYSQLEALDIPQACDYNVGWPQNEEFLIDTMRCSLRPHDKPVNAYLAAQSNYQTRSPASLKLRAFAALGAGARSLSFYEWGPRRFATENWYDTDREKLRVIGEVNHAIGWAEDILVDGRPRPSKVAIMFSRASDLWEALVGERSEMTERRQLFHLLRGLHQQPDAINDDFLPDLDQYRVIFLAQKCMTKSVADRLLAWAERGGTLIASGECGTCDELGRPAQQLKGKFIQTERLGLAYHTGVKLENDVLVGMQESVRDRVAQWLPVPDCATDNPLIGARLIESKTGCAIVLVNSTGQPGVEKVRVKVSTTGFQKVESLEQGALKFTADGFELPLGLTDIVTLLP